jgi:hypothetical protein
VFNKSNARVDDAEWTRTPAEVRPVTSARPPADQSSTPQPIPTIDWIAGRPTIPGWYWYSTFAAPERFEGPIEVKQAGVQNKLCVQARLSNDMLPVDTLPWDWAGPLPVPAAKKT